MSVSEDKVTPLNWSGGEGTGYYDPVLLHDALVRRLLMFYTANPQKWDIAIGNVSGTDPALPDPYPVGVGLDAMGFREPRH